MGMAYYELVGPSMVSKADLRFLASACSALPGLRFFGTVFLIFRSSTYRLTASCMNTFTTTNTLHIYYSINSLFDIRIHTAQSYAHEH